MSDPVAGPFTLTIKVPSIAGGTGSHVAAGGTEDGLHILEDFRVADINDDEHGDVPVDGVNRGVLTMVRFLAVDWEAVRKAIYATSARGNPKATVGHLVSKRAVEIKATPVAGTTAATLDGVYTFYKAVLKTNLDVLLGTGHRKADLTFQLYPDPSNANKLYDPADPVSPPPPP